MIIELTNTSARVAEASANETQWINTFLTFKEKDLVIMTKDGEVTRHERDATKLYNVELSSFPAGLAGRVIDAAPKAGVRVQVDDLRQIPGGAGLLHRARARAAEIERNLDLGGQDLGGVAPYKHQARAAVIALDRTRGILELPTGAGKGNLIVLMAQLYPVRWLVLVPSRALLEQTAERFEALTGETAGRIGDGKWAPDDRFTVATFQGLDAKLKVGDDEAGAWIQSVEAMAVDEVHSLTAGTFNWVVRQTKRAYLRIGLSATPLRGGVKDIHTLSSTGDLIYKVTPTQLHRLGLVAYPRVRAVPVRAGARVKTWATAHEKLIVYGRARNLAIALRCKNALANGDIPGLILVDKTKHGEAIAEAFTAVGLTVPLVHGKTKKSTQRAVLAGMREGTVPLAIATSIWRTGVDIPGLRLVFHASGGKASVPLLQGLGRGMRIERDKQGNPIKTSFLALDIADEGCSWLANHWRQRKAEYRRAGYEVAIE